MGHVQTRVQHTHGADLEPKVSVVWKSIDWKRPYTLGAVFANATRHAPWRSILVFANPRKSVHCLY